MNATAYRLLRRAQTSRSRLVFALGIGAVVMLAAVALRAGDAPRGALTGFVQGAGLAFVVPVVTLIFAVAALGDLAEDGTLVYLWLRPVPRLHLATAALAATLTVVVPLTVVPVAVAALLGGRPELGPPAAVAAAAGAAAYAALFLGLGLRTSRSLVWGLLYVLLWEGTISNLTATLAAVSVRRYVASLYTALADVGPARFAVDGAAAAVVLAAVIAAGVGLCTWLLRRQAVA